VNVKELIIILKKIFRQQKNYWNLKNIVDGAEKEQHIKRRNKKIQNSKAQMSNEIQSPNFEILNV